MTDYFTQLTKPGAASRSAVALHSSLTAQTQLRVQGPHARAVGHVAQPAPARSRCRQSVQDQAVSILLCVLVCPCSAASMASGIQQRLDQVARIIEECHQRMLQQQGRGWQPVVAPPPPSYQPPQAPVAPPPPPYMPHGQPAIPGLGPRSPVSTHTGLFSVHCHP